MMKWFWKYVFPPLFGLLIYTTIRVINDTVSEFKFWERNWTINAIEIVTCILVGYILHVAFQQLFRRFDKILLQAISYKTVLKELLWVIVIMEVIANATITPMAALTDDGLSWGDVATINIIPLLYCIIYYAVVRSNKLLKAYVNNKLLLEKLTNDHLQTELKFLKAQYHPHFLFNALNTIYFQMDEDIGATKKTVEKFSELLRYQLYDQQQTVSVSRELQHLQNYIDLQQVRSSAKLQLQVNFDPALNGQQVYPLLFLPLVENAFKYIGGDFIINISAGSKEGAICFRVENTIPREPVPFKNNSIGLENLKRRLELLYPGKHAFEAGKKEDRFIAEMTIEL